MTVSDLPIEFQIGSLLTAQPRLITVAESCTGGLIMSRLTDVPGSSAYFPGGFVTYSYEAKQQFIGVRAETLDRFGAVSTQTALEMARGARAAFHADVAIAVTGIAGPGGGTSDKPVGLVYIGLTAPDAEQVVERRWQGTRVQNKEQSAEAALHLLYDYLTGKRMLDI